MEDVKLVVVETYRNKVEADLAQGALEAAEIESMVSADDAGGVQPGLWASEGVRLLVRAEDLEEARKILNPSTML